MVKIPFDTWDATSLKHPPSIDIKMFIFIDESGSFAYSRDNKHTIACVGALSVPESRHSSLVKSFRKLKYKWGYGANEVKGKDLSEDRVKAVIDLLRNLDIKLHICATDVKSNPPEGLEKHRQAQSKALTANLTEAHHPNLVAELNELRRQLDGLSLQLYLQFCMMNELVASQLRDTTIYYAFKQPKELGNFRWVIDAKSDRVTTFETLWKLLVTSFLQSRHLKTELRLTIEGGDYTYFERFCGKIDKWPSYLPLPTSLKSANGPIEIIDVKKIMTESVAISDSNDKIGLQVADVCVNAFRRAVMGNLQHKAWSKLGELMLSINKHPVHLVKFDSDNPKKEDISEVFAKQIMAIEASSKSVLPR